MPEITSRSIPASVVQHLLDSGYPSALARIFAARGITDSQQLDTSLAGLLPFDSLKNAREMARLLADAIAEKKKFLVIADYDADGATACAVAVRGLRSFGAQADFIVPNRFEYGYGLTPEIVQLAAERKPDILLTVDNGIASVEGVAEANRLGMRVFVTDHHLPGDTLPDKMRPRGAFKGHPRPKSAGLLGRGAHGTVADVVKLDQNNRILIQQGL